MRKALLWILILGTSVAKPCFGWLQVIDETKKLNFYLRPNDDKKQVWAVDSQRRPLSTNFFVNEPGPVGPPLQLKIEIVREAFNKKWGETAARWTTLLTHLEDNNASWPIKPTAPTEEEYVVLTDLVQSQARGWKMPQETQKLAEQPQLSPEQTREIALQKQEAAARRGLQSSVADVIRNSRQAPYGKFSEPVPENESPLNRKPSSGSSTGYSQGYNSRDMSSRSDPYNETFSKSPPTGDGYNRRPDGSLRPKDRYFNLLHPLGRHPFR